MNSESNFNNRYESRIIFSPPSEIGQSKSSIDQQFSFAKKIYQENTKKVTNEAAFKQQTASQQSQEYKRILSEDKLGSKDISLMHCLAIKVGKPKNISPDLCPCCLRKIDDDLHWNFNPEDIGFLGIGYPQFYAFVKYCIFIIFAIIISSSSFNVLSNSMLGTDCIPDEMIDYQDIKSGDVCQLSMSTYFSLANKRNLPQIMTMQQILNFFTIITIIILLFKARIKFFLLADDLTSLFCPSAFTVFIENIPNKVEGLQGRPIERLIAATIKSTFKVEPIAVNVCWNLQDLKKLESQKDEVITTFQNKIDSLPENQIQQIGEYRRQIQLAKEEKYEQGFLIKKRLSLNLTDDDLIKYFTGKVFVVFNRFEEKERVLKESKKLNQEENPLFFGDYYDISTLSVPVLENKNEKRKKKGAKISQAVPPNEIIWENAQYSNNFVRKRKILFWGASVLCMIVCYVLIGGLLQLQRMFSTSQLELVENGIWVQTFAILVSILVNVLNFILKYLLTEFNEKTYFTLKTDASINMASKLGIAYFLNSGIMAFIIDVIIPRFTKENGIQAARVAIYRTGGLIYNMQYIFIMNALVIPTMALIDTSKLFQFYNQWTTDKKLKDVRKCSLTQKQMNNIYMNPVSDLVHDYALIISQMYFMAFYSPLIPIGTGTTLFVLCSFYIIHKFKLAKHRSLLNNVGPQLCIEMTEMIEMIAPIYCFSNLIFEYLLSENNVISNYALLGFFIGVLNAILPMDKLKNLFLDRDENEYQFAKPTYFEIKEKFETDYDVENPVTKDTYLRYVQESQRNEILNVKYNKQQDEKTKKQMKYFQANGINDQSI